MAAAMAAMIIFFGVSATVLGSRSDVRRPPRPTTVVAPLAPGAAALPAPPAVPVPQAAPVTL